MKVMTTQSSATRATKDMVPATVHMQNGQVITGELFVLKHGQRLQDLLNDGTRKFLPLRSNSGALMFINRDRMEMIVERDE